MISPPRFFTSMTCVVLSHHTPILTAYDTICRDPYPLSALVLNCTNIFTCGMTGVSSLLPDFLQACKIILLHANGSSKEYLTALHQRDALADARKQEFDWTAISGNTIASMEAGSAKFWKAPPYGSVPKTKAVVNPTDEWSGWGRQERRNIPYMDTVENVKLIGGVPEDLLRRAASRLISSISAVPSHFLDRASFNLDTIAPIAYVKALFKFTGTDQTDLDFDKEDIIAVLKKGLPDSDEWWIGRIGESVGCFPYNYVQEITDHDLLSQIKERERSANAGAKAGSPTKKNISAVLVEEKIEDLMNHAVVVYKEASKILGKILVESFKGESDPMNVQVIQWKI
jgi:hypothetical protein